MGKKNKMENSKMANPAEAAAPAAAPAQPLAAKKPTSENPDKKSQQQVQKAQQQNITPEQQQKLRQQQIQRQKMIQAQRKKQNRSCCSCICQCCCYFILLLTLTLFGGVIYITKVPDALRHSQEMLHTVAIRMRAEFHESEFLSANKELQTMFDGLFLTVASGGVGNYFLSARSSAFGNLISEYVPILTPNYMFQQKVDLSHEFDLRKMQENRIRGILNANKNTNSDLFSHSYGLCSIGLFQDRRTSPAYCDPNFYSWIFEDKKKNLNESIGQKNLISSEFRIFEIPHFANFTKYHNNTTALSKKVTALLGVPNKSITGTTTISSKEGAKSYSFPKGNLLNGKKETSFTVIAYFSNPNEEDEESTAENTTADDDAQNLTIKDRIVFKNEDITVPVKPDMVYVFKNTDSEGKFNVRSEHEIKLGTGFDGESSSFIVFHIRIEDGGKYGSESVENCPYQKNVSNFCEIREDGGKFSDRRDNWVNAVKKWAAVGGK